MAYLNRIVFEALKENRIMKHLFDIDFAVWYEGAEAYRVTFKVTSITRDEIARLKSAGVVVESVDAYTNNHVQVFARVPDINRVHGHINDRRKHVIPTK